MEGDLDIEKAADALIELAAVIDCNVEEITELLSVTPCVNHIGVLLSEEEIRKILWLTNPDE